MRNLLVNQRAWIVAFLCAFVLDWWGLQAAGAQVDNRVVEVDLKLNSPHPPCQALAPALAGRHEPAPDCKVLNPTSRILRLRWAAANVAEIECMLADWKSTGFVVWFRVKVKALKP